MSTLTQIVDVYKAQTRVSLAENTQYRMQMIMSMARIMTEPVIYLVVWQVTARSSGGDVAGYSVDDFALYFIMWAFVRQMTVSWSPGMFEWRVRRGDFNPLLLRPIHPIHADSASILAWKIAEFGVLIPTLVILWIVFQPGWHPLWWSVLAFIPAVVLGALLRHIAMYALSLLVFWTTRLEALFSAWFLTEFFLSGRLAPLGVLPPFLRTIADVLPFQWMFAFPLELLLGNLSQQEMWTGFAIQATWLAVAFALFYLGWRFGVKRYSAVGG